MKRLAIVSISMFLLCGCATLCLGQSTAVTLQITDADAQTWNNGTWIVTLYSPSGVPPGPYNIIGTSTPVPNQTQSGSLNATGGASLTLTPNASIVPSGTQWQFTICAQASPWPCVQSLGTIAGASQTVTITPPGIRINLANPATVVTAYQDLELVGQVIGSTYYNLTAGTSRQWNGLLWVSAASGAAGGSNTQIQFNSAGSFAGDSSLTWNNTTKSVTVVNTTSGSGTGAALNIGTPLGNPQSPGGILLTGSLSAPAFSSTLEIHNPFSAGVNVFVHTDAAHAFRGPVFTGYRSEGTQALPTAVGAADNLIYVQGFGYNGSAYATGGTFECFANQTWTTSNQGAYCQVFSTPSNTNSPVASMTFGNTNSTISTANVGILNANPAAEFALQTSAGGRIAFGTPNAAPTDGDLLLNQTTWYDDETNTNLVARIKYNGAGLHSATIPVDVGLSTIYSCGTAAACSPTNLTKPRIFIGSAPLVSGTPSTVTITGISPTFTSASSYFCTVTDATNAANNLLRVANVSGSSFTITGPNTLTDTINYVCAGN